ncbi:hypothetical protein [Pseudomonas virus PBPA162]|uniref:Uncharacterized protein n=3 Tax=Viruses TaxID=10239 RepID=A0A7S5AYU5_9CAUD|nr:minor tail protein [Pseudomonas phage Iggy]YP_010671789.1 hypothetical protein PQC32_gp26 [Pseudomonas virus PBPA162]QDB70860.1 hypothetical protein [Pseudomonas virus PBPA162]QEA09750.1 hypothetical protein [Pseudomonas phage Iggy]WPK40877.1 minor tail protein [Pseudomonas phage Knedl]
MSYSKACIEAIASVNNEELMYDTLELHHPLLQDDDGNHMAVRLCIGHDDLEARLEPGAPMDGGQVVKFTAADFDFTLPDVGEGQMPQLSVRLANVGRDLTRHIEQAAISYEPFKMYYRPYLDSNRLVGPEVDVPFMFELAQVTVDIFMVSGTATLEEVHNWPFPNKTYKPEIFKGLVR